MRWTKKPPEEEGWYWIKRVVIKTRKILQIEIVYIRNYVDKLCIGNWEIPETDEHKIVYWCGPIDQPIPELKRRR